MQIHRVRPHCRLQGNTASSSSRQEGSSVDPGTSSSAPSKDTRELEDRIKSLERALAERDEQATELIESCNDMDETGQVTLAKVRQESL
eukprot:g24940.t1